MIQRSCFGTKKDCKYLFSSVGDPDKDWKSSRLTAVLRRLTKDVTGIETGVQVYRQLSIAATERHLAHISTPFNRFDDKTKEANVDVTLAWQSGHRLMQRGTSYYIDAAYPDSLQPALLRVYRWTSNIWHMFLDETQDNNAGGATSFTRTNNGRDARPRKHQRINHATTHPRTPKFSGTTLQPTPVDVDMAPPTADDAVEQVSVRSTTPCSARVGESETLEEIPRDSVTALAFALSMPARSRVRSSRSVGRDTSPTSATRQPASRDERAPTRRLFSSSKKKFATDWETGWFTTNPIRIGL
jgi:hypothetical protein